jgi:hypothetical protein
MLRVIALATYRVVATKPCTHHDRFSFLAQWPKDVNNSSSTRAYMDQRKGVRTCLAGFKLNAYLLEERLMRCVLALLGDRTKSRDMKTMCPPFLYLRKIRIYFHYRNLTVCGQPPALGVARPSPRRTLHRRWPDTSQTYL